MRARHLGRLGLAIALLALAPGARAVQFVVEFDGASVSQKGDFKTTPYLESIATTSVDAGHYELIADAHGAAGDLAFNIDEDTLGLTQVTIQVGGGLPFDAVSLDVVNPAEAVNPPDPPEFTISAIGGTGSISAPTTIGQLVFPAGFQGITGLVITQNSAGAFAFDALTLPEPSGLVGLAAGALALAALRRRRAR